MVDLKGGSWPVPLEWGKEGQRATDRLEELFLGLGLWQSRPEPSIGSVLSGKLWDE